METMLQAVVVVFMLFLCALCLFAVVVIARDIIHESARRKEERNEVEQVKEVVITPPAPIEIPITVTPTVLAPVAEPAPVEEKAEEPAPVVVAPVEEKVEEPAPVVVVPVIEAEEPEEEIAVTEEDPDAVSFSRVTLTMEEKYATLSTEFKRHFDDIIKHAMAKEGVQENRRTSSYDYKIGAYKVLRMLIKRGEIVCEFNFIDKEFAEYASASDVRMKKSATTVRVTEASAVGVVKDGIDLVCSQIAEDKERKKELAREKRREKRRKAKEAEGLAEATKDETATETAGE